MPKGSTKSGVGKNIQMIHHGGSSDFTLNDYANTASSGAYTGRMKKSVINSMSINARQTCGTATENAEALAWYDKDLTEFDTEDGGEDEGEEEDDELSHSPPVKRVLKKHPTVPQCEGRLYPLDLWFLISEHIRPEDVGRFAGICQGAHIAVHTVKFWTTLYHRYYTDKRTDLPLTLSPVFMEKTDGLWARVIRSLFYLYPPFQERVKRQMPFQNDLDLLEGKTCTLMWHKKEKSLYHFCFKLRKPDNRTCRRSLKDTQGVVTGRHKTLWDFAPDLNSNPESEYCVLQVVVGNYISLPIVMGEILSKSFLSVGHGMRYHKLKLAFGGPRVRDDKSAVANGTLLVMDPVINIRVLQWWDPSYPYNETIVLSPMEESELTY